MNGELRIVGHFVSISSGAKISEKKKSANSKEVNGTGAADASGLMKKAEQKKNDHLYVSFFFILLVL